jgi:hypothetical protein
MPNCLLIAIVFIFVSAVRCEHHNPGDPLSDKDHYKVEGEHDAKYDHEAFLGKDTAAEYDDLTPEKSKERLARLVPKMDLDEDGFVTEDELRQ